MVRARFWCGHVSRRDREQRDVHLRAVEGADGLVVLTLPRDAGEEFVEGREYVLSFEPVARPGS